MVIYEIPFLGNTYTEILNCLLDNIELFLEDNNQVIIGDVLLLSQGNYILLSCDLDQRRSLDIHNGGDNYSEAPHFEADVEYYLGSDDDTIRCESGPDIMNALVRRKMHHIFETIHKELQEKLKDKWI